jgi:hypothetical protein
VEVGPNHQERKGDIGAPIKLDAEAQAHIEKHRYLYFVLILQRLFLFLGSSLILSLAKWQVSGIPYCCQQPFIVHNTPVYRVYLLIRFTEIAVSGSCSRFSYCFVAYHLIILVYNRIAYKQPIRPIVNCFHRDCCVGSYNCVMLTIGLQDHELNVLTNWTGSCKKI